MTSPRGTGCAVPEGTHVVLREVTASLHGSSPMQSSCFQSGNDSSSQKTSEYEVKVRFAREFADVGSIGYTVPESLSSSSSFQSLSSTRSTKSSSGVCSDSVTQSLDRISDTSYLDSSIPGVDELILGCAEIKLNSEEDSIHYSRDNSLDQTFASAADQTITDFTKSLGNDSSLLVDSCNVPEVIETSPCTQDLEDLQDPQNPQDLQDRPILVIPLIQPGEPIEVTISTGRSDDLTTSSETCSFDNVEELPLPSHSTEESNLNTTKCLSPGRVSPDTPIVDDQQIVVEDIQAQVVVEDFRDQTEESIAVNIVPYSVTDSVSSVSSVSPFAEYTEDLSLPSISTLPSLQLTNTSRLCENETHVNNSNLPITKVPENLLNSSARETGDKNDSQLATLSSDFCDAAISRDSCTNLLSETSSAIPRTSERAEDRLEADAPAETEDDRDIKDVKPPTPINSRSIEAEAVLEETDATESLKETEDVKGEQSSEEKLAGTLIVKNEPLTQEPVPEEDQYKDFKPQRQSTTLGLPDVEQPNFDELKSSAEQVANDICKSSFEFPEESDCFTTATSDIFQDPTSFDFLIARGNSKTRNRLRAESLYVKFDPLVGDTSTMLLQENTDPINEEEQNGKTESPPPSIVTPKRNPAIAAIDRLLFYSPITTNMTPKTEEPKEKSEQAADEPKSDTPFINDVNMSKELELVRATVLQLEEELEKQKKEHKAELEKLERQKNSLQEKINQLQAQMAQEVKSKSDMKVVVEEYEKTISRMLAEKGRDQEELKATNVHLSNTEAAFNDVHQKYEKMKSVVSVYKNNEIVLRESIQENMDTIKCLHTRYDSLKAHALSQLEKANSDLENIRKQHEDEIVTLHALVRKAELKSNSLAELVEQKTKENKELTQILDEVIARVGHQNTE